MTTTAVGLTVPGSPAAPGTIDTAQSEDVA